MKVLNFKNLVKRIKSQKGMSGVIVALGLVVAGVGLVVIAQTAMNGQVTQINTKVSDALSGLK
jgi:hypothetical protein